MVRSVMSFVMGCMFCSSSPCIFERRFLSPLMSMCGLLMRFLMLVYISIILLYLFTGTGIVDAWSEFFFFLSWLNGFEMSLLTEFKFWSFSSLFLSFWWLNWVVAGAVESCPKKFSGSFSREVGSCWLHCLLLNLGFRLLLHLRLLHLRRSNGGEVRPW